MKLTLPFFGDREQNSAELKLGQRSSMLEYDQALVWVTLLLLLIGLVMVYSASIAMPTSPDTSRVPVWRPRRRSRGVKRHSSSRPDGTG